MKEVYNVNVGNSSNVSNIGYATNVSTSNISNDSFANIVSNTTNTSNNYNAKVVVHLGEARDFEIEYKQRVEVISRMRGDQHDNPFKKADSSFVILSNAQTGERIVTFEDNDDSVTTRQKIVELEPGIYRLSAYKTGGKGAGSGEVRYNKKSNIISSGLKLLPAIICSLLVIIFIKIIK